MGTYKELQIKNWARGQRVYEGIAADIKARLTCRQYLERIGVEIKHDKCLSPFRAEKTPSLHLYEDGSFYDFGAGVGGDIFTLIQELEGVAFSEALKIAAGVCGVEAPQKRAKPPTFREQQRKAITALQSAFESGYTKNIEIQQYLSERFGVGSEKLATLAKMWGWGYSADLALPDFLPAFRDRWVFPIRDQHGDTISFAGRIWRVGGGGAKYVNGAESELFSKKAHLYGLDVAKRNLRKNGTVVVTEGYFDVQAASALELGLRYSSKQLLLHAPAVAVMGARLSVEQLELLINAGAKRIVLAFDADGAGQAATASALELMNAHISDLHDHVEVQIMVFPSGVKDLGDYAVNQLKNAPYTPAEIVPFWQWVVRYSDYLDQVRHGGYEVASLPRRRRIYETAMTMLPTDPRHEVHRLVGHALNVTPPPIATPMRHTPAPMANLPTDVELSFTSPPSPSSARSVASMLAQTLSAIWPSALSEVRQRLHEVWGRLRVNVPFSEVAAYTCLVLLLNDVDAPIPAQIGMNHAIRDVLFEGHWEGELHEQAKAFSHPRVKYLAEKFHSDDFQLTEDEKRFSHEFNPLRFWIRQGNSVRTGEILVGLMLHEIVAQEGVAALQNEQEATDALQQHFAQRNRSLSIVNAMLTYVTPASPAEF